MKTFKYSEVFLMARRHMKLNQIEMSKKLLCSQGLISKIENGVQDPPLRVFQKLVEVCPMEFVRSSLLGM